MRTRTTGALVGLVLQLTCIACGDGRAAPEPDAGVVPDLDAAPDAPSLPEPDCYDCDSLAAAVAARLLPLDVPGWALAIAADGEVRCSAHYEGVACLGGDPVSAETAFLTGWALAPPAAVLEAAHEGQFTLDAPLSPESLGLEPAGWEELLTVGRALQSSSGLPSGWSEVALCADDLMDVLDDGFGGSPMWAPPGWITSHEPWSNELLARWLESADGRPFADSVHARVLDPLGMTGTRVGTFAAQSADSCGYLPSTVGLTRARLPCEQRRFGVGRSTLDDLLAIGHALTHEGRARDGSQALRPETVAAMFAPDGPTNFWDHSLRWTNGLSIVDGSDPPVAVLEGYGDGHSTTVVLVPADPVTGVGDRVIVLLANLDSDRVGLALTPVTRCFAGIEWPPPDWRAFVPWDGTGLEEYRGDWDNTLEGGTAVITSGDETLEIEIDGETFSLRPIGLDVFALGETAADGLVSFWRPEGTLSLFTSLNMPYPLFPPTPFWRRGVPLP